MLVGNAFSVDFFQSFNYEFTCTSPSCHALENSLIFKEIVMHPSTLYCVYETLVLNSYS